MKPSVQDATHYDRIFNVWYKTGETIAHYWDYDKKGWARSAFEREDLENEGEIITAQEALEQGYKYPQYPTTTQGVIVDSTPSGEVSEASAIPVYNLPDSNTTYRKTVDDLYEDHFDKMKKINEAISDYPFITHKQLELLRDNGYKVNSVGVFKGGVLQAKPDEQDDFYDDCHKGPYIFVNEPLIPDMTEANDRKQRVETSVTSANNRQVGGDHYKKMKIQPWDLFGSIFNLDEQIGFYLGNVYKYLMRYDSKNGIEDLMKAKHYLEKLIEVKRGAASADAGGK